MVRPKKMSDGTIYFSDYPDFRPNLSPRDIFTLGSFGGTYWREIYSHVTKKAYHNVHHKYSFLKGIDEYKMSLPYNEYDKEVNKYGVKVGTTLEFWEHKNWITKWNPYGWVHWYFDFYSGRRCPDDERQIKRWMQTAGPNSRFRLNLINQIKRSRKTYNDYSVSPAIRQTLQHWAYKLTSHDFKNN